MLKSPQDKEIQIHGQYFSVSDTTFTQCSLEGRDEIPEAKGRCLLITFLRSHSYMYANPGVSEINKTDPLILTLRVLHSLCFDLQELSASRQLNNKGRRGGNAH